MSRQGYSVIIVGLIMLSILIGIALLLRPFIKKNMPTFYKNLYGKNGSTNLSVFAVLTIIFIIYSAIRS